MSHLVKQSQLKEILGHSWRKTKERYDGAFVNAEIPTTEKKITFTKADSTKQNVSLADYARLKDQNNFEQDVAADNVAVIDNSGIGTGSTHTSRNRGLGFRQLTTKAFKDGYVDHIKIYMDNSLQADAATTWKVWAITKDGTNKSGDRVKEVVLAKNLNVKVVQEGGQEKKIVEIPVNKRFEKETYFIVRCNHDVLVVTDIKSEYRKDVVNLNNIQPPDEVDSTIDWDAGLNSENNTAIMYLYGRESIGSLSEKINTIKSGQVLSVNTQRPDTNGNITIGISDIDNLQTQLDAKVPMADLVPTGGTSTQHNKVPKLDANGKLDKSFIPEIAITRVLSAPNESAVQNMIGDSETRLQTGDVVVLADSKKAYMYKGQTGNAYSFANDFLELTMGNGTVKSVSRGTPDTNGNISVSVVEGVTTGITMSFGTGGDSVTVATYMTTEEVTAIKDLFV